MGQGDGNLALVTGRNNTAFAQAGNRNQAFVNGADNYAFSAQGNANVVKVRGSNSTAYAYQGDGNRAIVRGRNSTAMVGGPGSGYHIAVIGDDASGNAPALAAQSSPTEVGH